MESNGGRRSHPDGLTIGQLAGRAGVGVETLRYYEREGLLPKPQRSGCGYRQYGKNALTRLQFITWAKGLGFTLGEVKELLKLSDESGETPADFREAAMQKIDWIDRRVAELKDMRALIADSMAEYRRPEEKDICPLLALYRKRMAKGDG